MPTVEEDLQSTTLNYESLFFSVEEDLSSPHSFVSFVNLDCHVRWSGQIIAKWDLARAAAKSEDDSEEDSYVNADGYKVAIRRLGDSSPLRELNVSHPTSSHSFGGISMDDSYEVSVDCIFGRRTFPCGRQAILSCKNI